jgi:hypothetical protein
MSTLYGGVSENTGNFAKGDRTAFITRFLKRWYVKKRAYLVFYRKRA